MFTKTDSLAVPPILNEELRKLIPISKVLVIGAGGIGCEILKNLALTGFEDIEIIDLDTIDVSNLNRQFLFHKEHVGKSKAVVARESILSYNPNIKIKAYHDSITSTDYGVNFYQQFRVVLNALDNRAARNHVNRMCLAADVPLIESGTSGYVGQVELVKKGLTQCYECQPKVPPKTYPGCTIRNTPSEPVHCIVWSKHLFNQLFGEDDADQDVSPDIADPEAASDVNNLDTHSGNVERKSTRVWAKECDYEPKKLFNKFFKEDIEYLLTMKSLWTTRKSPIPLPWEAAASHEGDVSNKNDENIHAADMQVWSLCKCVRVFASTVDVLKKQLPDKEFLVWDKDDETALDFVTACTNIRAHIFDIMKKSRFDVKAIAGNIIPAIATSNAITAGLAVLMAFRVLSEKYKSCQTIYLRKISPDYKNVIVPEGDLQPPNPHCYVCSPQPFVKVFVNTETMLVKEFESEILKKELDMIAPDVMLDGKFTVVISSEEGETEVNNDKTLLEVGIIEGAVLKADDFLQNYKLTIAITHYVAKEKEDQLYKVDKNASELKPKCTENGSTEQNGSSKMHVDEENHDATQNNSVLIEVDDPLEGPSTKRHKKNPPEDDDDLIMLDEPH